MSITQIIMISYFRPNDFRASVESILRNTSGEFHISIIDNSHGGLDELLGIYSSNRLITIYRNTSNLGKGMGVMRWYNDIMGKSTADYFISIDADIQVYPHWLSRLQSARAKIKQPFALLAPVIMNRPDDWFIKQKHKLIMHNQTIFRHYADELYYNRYTAGPLFYIDREFFEQVGGYSLNQLYGSDDGKLCRQAALANKFIGIASNVHVLHLKNDEDIGYKKWKILNVSKEGDYKGYWD